MEHVPKLVVSEKWNGDVEKIPYQDWEPGNNPMLVSNDDVQQPRNKMADPEGIQCYTIPQNTE